MSSKKSRDSSKTKHSSKGDSREERHRGSSKDHRSTTDDQEERRRRSSKDYRSTTNDQDVSASRHRDKSKSKSSSKTNYVDEDAIALAEDEEERRRRKKQQRKQLEEEERLKHEQEERLKREQEEYEEERRRRKEKNRDVESGGSRKHKSSRAKSPTLDSSKTTSPVPPPTKHKNKPAEKDDNYSDDFEQNYDDDFDDEPIAPPVKKSTSNKEEKARTTYNESPPTKNYTSSSVNDNAQVYTSSRRFHSHDLSDRIRRRFKDLSRLIQLDRQSFNILDMAPMPAHAAYMRDIRLNKNNNQSSNEITTDTSWTANVKVQTNDDAEHVQSQTDEIDTRSMWTQHPSESEHTTCGSGSTSSENQLSDINKTRENEDLLRMLRLETDLARYQTFVINSGKLMFALLDEQQTSEVKSKSKRSKDKEQDGMQQESDLSFSSGATILPGLSLKPEVSVAAVCFFSDKFEQVAVFYEPIHTTSYGAIYNVRDPSKPLRLLSCEATIRSCSSSMVYIFAGCQDGSVVLFDTSEPNKYRTDSQKPIPSSPTFSTANIQFNDRHYNEVIRVLPLRATSVPNKNDRSMNSFSLASLDRDGLIIIWVTTKKSCFLSVVELMQSDEAGSIADLGLKPGGRVRMTQTSSIQIKQSIHMARDSIQAYDLSCPSSDFDNLYVASNANAVYHMTRHGEMGSPAKLRISSDLGSQIEVTCLSFNPLVSKLLLVGTGHGQLNLYTTGRDEPILTWSQAFRSSSIVLSCNWSTCRGSVFFAHDSQGYIKYWDLTKDQYQPLGQVKIENLSHFVLSTSNQYETAFALVIKQQSSQIEIHQLKQTLASHSETFTDNFKDILKKIMANT
ncbi:unnamed protein product [Rotaria magnacalcarata]|uniref:WD repeat-containing protein 60 n=1 Tax=Rotaria magnacalcarata TaxID=392030 RepID=A0A819AG80_9BILA|nr:unnamed protein product [Rotaria magnacalcarata]CAF3800576.1 unnamed protein product [Rotaria magnacalcarata]